MKKVLNFQIFDNDQYKHFDYCFIIGKADTSYKIAAKGFRIAKGDLYNIILFVP